MRYTVLAALLMSSTPAAADDCATLPRPQMRVRLTVPEDQARVLTTIREIVDWSWEREGLAFEWLEGADGPGVWTGIDAWIAVVRRTRPVSNGDILGEVPFRQGVPGRLIRIYIDTVVTWLQRDQANRLRHGARVVGLPPDVPETLPRALGQIAAHEVGHFVLGSVTHAEAGLMQARYQHPHRILGAGPPLGLDTPSRARLHARLAARAACP